MTARDEMRGSTRRLDTDMLLIAESGQKGTSSYLKNANVEIETVADIMRSNVGSCKSITSPALEAVINSLENTSIVHFSCHGQQDLKDALASGFLLRHGVKLTIAELMQLKLSKAFFAFLSACETAKGDNVQPDQTVHLAAAMLYVGFKSIVGTMW